MANSKSAAKSAKQAASKRERNRSVRSEVRTEVKKFVKLVREGKLSEAETQVRVAESKLDKAAKRNTFHPSKADRLKSRLKTRLATAAAPSA